jgi:sugar phosphate isomerase/epimerase
MKLNRRNFLRQAGIATATAPILLNQFACTPAARTEEKKSDSTATMKIATEPSVKEFGIQLWSVRDDLAKNPKAVLKQLADNGYKFVESFSPDNKDIFWKMSPKDFKAYLSSIGMTIYSAHCNPEFTLNKKKEEEFKKLVDKAASIDMKYLINPYMGNVLKTIDDFKKASDGFNRCGAICQKAGLQYGYHNHHYAFQSVDGQLPENVLLENTDPKSVMFEMDLYWVTMAGQDPIAWLKKHPNRFRLVHVKDSYSAEKIAEMNKVEKLNPDFPFNSSCDLGKGVIDFPKILNVAKQSGVEHFIVEQERWDNSTPLKSATADAEYMKKLVFS